MRRKVVGFGRAGATGAVVLSLLAAACGPGVPAASQPTSAARAPGGRAPPAPPVPVLEWQPCGPDFPGRECAVATVPLDYDRPRGATTEVALARIPASDPANRIGSLFVNPGGPGESGVDVVLSADGEGLSAQLEGRFDVVGFDPRGVGASDPLHCFASAEERAAYVASVPAFPYQRGQYRPFFETARNLEHECLDDRQAVAAHMSTADVARDLDLLRQAVGDPELTYLGFSYGSYLGTTYANLFPGNVRAVVIDGVLDPRLWSGGWQVSADRTDLQEEFDEFLRLCDEAGANCAFSAPEGSRARWEALAEALRARPLELPDGTVVTYDRLINRVGEGMYRPEEWADPDDGTAVVLDLVADLVLGGQGGAAAGDAAAQQGSLSERLAGSAADAEAEVGARAEADYPNGFDAFYGNHCADTEYPSSFGDYLAIDRYAASGSRFGPWSWWLYAGCARWPVNDDRYVGPWGARTSAPMLVVGNYFDGITGYSGAVATAQLMPGSRLLSYAGWGHTAYGRSACVSEHINTYLVDGTLPPAGTVCPANPNPFSPTALTAAVGGQPVAGRPPSWLFGR